MRRARRIALGLLGGLVAAIVLLLLAVRLRYGAGETGFPDRTGAPLFGADAMERVASLPLPPGNIAVAPDGRLFFTFHPEAHPPVAVAEWRGGQAVPFGAEEGGFQGVLSMRIDRRGRLWTLDNAHHGVGQARLLAFDLASGKVVHRWEPTREIAPLGSHLNDFQVAPDGNTVYIADASIFAQRPALVVYDVAAGRGRRLLEGRASVRAEPFIPVVQGRAMRLFGVFSIQPGVDSIALDTDGEWLSFAAVTSRKMFRVGARDLRDPGLDAAALAGRVEAWADKTMSDGLSVDRDGGVYLTDPEHSAIVRLGPDGKLQTLVKDDRLRWPDGLSFGPDGWLYVTCSALHQVLGRLPSQVRAAAPFEIWRFRPGHEGVPGH